MSYGAYQVVRLHGRDLIFLFRYLKERCRKHQYPYVLCNSYGKSGTHLLYQILYSLPGLQKWNGVASVQALCGLMNSQRYLRWCIGSVPDRGIIRAHLMYCPEVLEILAEFRMKRLFIIRDLRDVVVSLTRWIMKEPHIYFHHVYQTYFQTWDERLMASICGFPKPFGSNVSMPDIGQHFSQWKGWITDSDTLTIRFEDIVGERGGGNEDARFEIIENIIDFLEISISSGEIRKTLSSYTLNPEESHTFQKGGGGKIGGWHDYFTDEHKTAFKHVAGNILVELGYEKDLDW